MTIEERLTKIEQDILQPYKFSRLDTITYGQVVYDPGNILAAGNATTTLNVIGANLGDWVIVSAPYDLQGMQASGYVSSVNTVTIDLFNATALAIDLASGIWRVIVIRRFF